MEEGGRIRFVFLPPPASYTCLHLCVSCPAMQRKNNKSNKDKGWKWLNSTVYKVCWQKFKFSAGPTPQKVTLAGINGPVMWWFRTILNQIIIFFHLRENKMKNERRNFLCLFYFAETMNPLFAPHRHHHHHHHHHHHLLLLLLLLLLLQVHECKDLELFICMHYIAFILTLKLTPVQLKCCKRSH